MDDTTRANGYKHGRPEGRDVKPADEIVRKVIEALPAETRLYPDVYAWQVTDALEAATSAPAVDREALASVLEADECYERDANSAGWVFHPRLGADALIASGLLRDVRDVQAETLEQAADAMEAAPGPLEEYREAALEEARYLRARAQAIREARSER